jgi:formylglycine-generating enzyme required for sulfatase activity
MGSPATEAGRLNDELQHEVRLTQGFWMAKTETTQAQWEALMPFNPSRHKGARCRWTLTWMSPGLCLR